MAIGLYLAFNPPVPDAQLGSDGKLLGKHLDTLGDVAKAAGVAPLVSYMDQRVPDDDVFDIDDFMASWDEWFEASAGIQTVQGLLVLMRASSSPFRAEGDALHLPEQLEELLRCLERANSQGARFRIEIVM